MKTSFAFLVAFPMIAIAADEPSLAFPEAKLQVPPLSLLELSKSGAASRPSIPAISRFPARSDAHSNKVVSAMPMVVPRDDLDSKMVKAPDPSIEYKMIVQEPKMERSK